MDFMISSSHGWVEAYANGRVGLGAFLSLINEGYIFIRGLTCIRWGMVSGQTDRYMSGFVEWVDGY